MQHFVQHNTTFLQKYSTTEYNKVAWGGQMSTTSYDIPQNKRNVISYNICLVKSLNPIKLHTTRYNIQQGGQTSAKFHTASKLYDDV